MHMNFQIDRFHKDVLNGVAPYFVFGDFNFRCDTEGVVKVLERNILFLVKTKKFLTEFVHSFINFYRLQKLAEDLTIHRVLNVKNDHHKVQYRDSNAQNVLTIGKKEFHHVEHQTKFKESWV